MAAKKKKKTAKKSKVTKKARTAARGVTRRPSRAVRAGGRDAPRDTIVIVGEDGTQYKLLKSDWVGFETEPSGAVTQVANFGAFVAFIPDDVAVGFGFNCTVVNLKAILRGVPDPDAPGRDE